MIMIIRCSNCKKEGALPFMLEWRYDSKYCRICGESKEFDKNYHFCSDKCLKEFVNRFAEHEHKWVEEYEGSTHKICEVCLRPQWEIENESKRTGDKA